MEQWIYARLFDATEDVFCKACKEFNNGKEFVIDDETTCEILENLNKISFLLGAVLRKR